MRPSPIRRAASGSIPAALRSKASLRTAFATALAAAIGFAPAIIIATPASADPGEYSIADKTAVEGGNIVFTITREGLGGGQLAGTVTYSTFVDGVGDNPAAAGSDYTAVSGGTVSFPATSSASDQIRTITITGLQDAVDEPDAETFLVRLTGSTQGSLADDEATGTIADNDNPTYALTTAPTTVNESASDVNRKATITARLSAVSPYDVTIPVATSDGTAKAPQDYETVSETITIEAGDRTGTVVVPVVNDTIDEADVQSFTVVGSTAANVSGTSTVTVNIADNDAAPSITLTSNGEVTEGEDVVFTPTLSGQSEQTVTARFDTANGPATPSSPAPAVAVAGSDYTAVTNGTVTFEPLSTSATTDITVSTLTDDVDEASPEDFSVKLSAPVNATLGSPSSATGEINDEEGTEGPSLSLTPGTLLEGDAAMGATRTFTATLSKVSGRTQTVHYAAAPGDVDGDVGIAGEQDFKEVTGTLVFAPGETVKTFTVTTYGDTIDEDAGENIKISLTQSNVEGSVVSGGALGDTNVTITDDDAKPVFSLVRTSVAMPEGDEYSPALFAVKLSNPSIHDVDFDVTDLGTGTARPGGTDPGDDDYDLVSTSGTVAAGQTSGYALVVINGDKVYEGNDTVKLSIARDDSDATGDAVAATLTIMNDDAAPVLAITNGTGVEGTDVPVSGVITGVSATDTLLDVSFAGGTVAGSDPAEPGDFVDPGKIPLTIDAGTPSGTVVQVGTVRLTDDTVHEASETIVVSGSGFAGTGSVASGLVTITDNDVDVTPPTMKPTLMAPPYRLGVGSIDLTGKAVKDSTVDLWAAPVSGGSFAKVATTTANADGNYTFTRSFTTMGYRFQTQSTGLTSDPVTVWLKHDPVLVANSPSKGAAALKVTGDPKVGGLNVIMQALVDGEWANVDTGVTNPTSGLVIKTIYGLKTGTTYAFRAYVVGDEAKGLQGGYSGTRRVVIS